MSALTIVQQDGEELFTTSEAIADGSGVAHDSVKRLIRDSHRDLAEFGLVGFEIRANSTVRGEREEKVWKLNEQQATLILTYLRNTEKVRAFKKALVRAFYEMAKQLQAPALTNDEIVAQALQITSARIKELEPKAEAYDVFLTAEGDYAARDAAQILTRDHGIRLGQNRLFRWMRENGWIDSGNQPYQHRIDQGLLRLKPGTFRFVRTNGEEQLAPPQVRVTPKGLERLRAEIKDAA